MALHDQRIVVQQVKNGDPVGGISVPTTTNITIDDCNVQPVGTAESIGQPEPITSRWRVSTDVDDPHDEIRPQDTVLWNGGEFEVQGEVQTFYAIRPHTEFIITRTGG